MQKIDKKTTIIAIFLISFPLLFALLYFVITKLLNSSSFLYHNTEELALISHYSFWWYLIRFDIYSYFSFLLPIFITILCCSRFFKIYHSGMILNLLQKINYNDILKKEIFVSWKKNLILPIILFVFFIISYFIFPNSSINIGNTGMLLYPFQIGHEYMAKMNPFLFVLLYLLIIFLYGIIITNIGIILSRYIKKISLMIIGNFLVVILLENIFNFFLAPIAKMLTKIDRMANGFSILNLYYLDGIPSLWWEFTWALILICITTLIISKIYHNKEKVLLNYD